MSILNKLETYITETKVPVSSLKQADRVIHNGNEMLVSRVLEDKGRVILRKEDELAGSGRLLFTDEDGNENTIEKVEV